MAFPTVPIIADFSSAGTLNSGDWAQYGHGTGAAWTATGGEAENGASYSGSYWNHIFGVDQEAYWTFTDPPTGTDYVGLYVRHQNPGAGSGQNCYLMGCVSGTTSLSKKISDTEFTLDSISDTPSTGHKWGISGIVSDIKSYKDTGGGWTEVMSAVDATYTGGYVAFDSFAIAGLINVDNLGAGDSLDSPPAYPVIEPVYRDFKIPKLIR